MSRVDTEDAILAYKKCLSEMIDKRPSGTRQRLADALGKHRSFVTQITSVSYPTPVPLRHLPTILSVCHVAPEERRYFLDLYQTAHPQHADEIAITLTGSRPMRHVSLLVHDLGGENKNRAFDEALAEFAHKVGSLMADDEPV